MTNESMSLAEKLASRQHEECILDWEKRRANGFDSFTQHGVDSHFEYAEIAAKVAEEHYSTLLRIQKATMQHQKEERDALEARIEELEAENAGAIASELAYRNELFVKNQLIKELELAKRVVEAARNISPSSRQSITTRLKAEILGEALDAYDLWTSEKELEIQQRNFKHT